MYLLIGVEESSCEVCNAAEEVPMAVSPSIDALEAFWDSLPQTPDGYYEFEDVEGTDRQFVGYEIRPVEYMDE